MSIKDKLNFHSAVGLLIIGALAMGASPSFARWSGLDVFASAFWRVGFALPVLFIWAWLENGTIRFKPMDRATFWAGVFFAGDLAFWHLSIFNTSMANATLFSCLAPIWVLLLSRIVLNEAVTLPMFMGVILCLAGALILMGGGIATKPENFLGDVFGIITSLFFGLYFLAMRFARRGNSAGAATITLQASFVTAIILLLIALAFGEKFWPETITGIFALLALGVISHAGGQGLLSVAIGALSAAFSSMVIFMEVVAAVILGWFFFNEPLTFYQMAGAILILIGVFTSRPTKHAKIGGRVQN